MKGRIDIQPSPQKHTAKNVSRRLFSEKTKPRLLACKGPGLFLEVKTFPADRHRFFMYPCRAQKHTPAKRPGTGRIHVNRRVSIPYPVRDVSNMHVPIPYRCRGVSNTPAKRPGTGRIHVNRHVPIPYPVRDISNMYVSIPYRCRGVSHTPTRRPGTGRIHVNRHISRMRIKMNDDE